MEELDEFEREEARFEAVANGLRDTGLSASSQDTGGGMTCVIVDLPNNGRIIWGTADVMWGGAIHNADDDFVAGIETDCPSDTEDIATIVLALKEPSLANGAIQQKN